MPRQIRPIAAMLAPKLSSSPGVSWLLRITFWTLLHHKVHRKAAERFWDGLRSGVAVIEAVGLADLEVAWEIGNAWRDQDFSIVDRTSFAVMRRLGIDDAASLDDHFSVFRFGPRRRQSFNVVR
jgi:uncharacterized protein